MTQAAEKTGTLFDFITSDDFRAGLEADHRELLACMEGKAWKAVHVLAGSIIEAVLVDCLLALGYQDRHPEKKLLEMMLGQIIDACKSTEENILSEETASLCGIVKDYRNLIHPGRVQRLGKKVKPEGAQIAQALIPLIVESVAARKKEVYGYTAEQLLRKVQSDPSSFAILGHLLKDVKEIEKERLLMKILPNAYYEWLRASEAEPVDTVTLNNFERLFRAVFDQVSTVVQKQVAQKFVGRLKEESDVNVLWYEDAFFRATDIILLPYEDQEIVRKHLLARMENYDFDEAFFNVLPGIGFWLQSEEEVKQFIHFMVRTVRRSKHGNIFVVVLFRSELFPPDGKAF